MKTIDRIHHICLTVSSENFEETWPKELANHAPGGWGGLGEMLDHPEHSKQFGVFER